MTQDRNWEDRFPGLKYRPEYGNSSEFTYLRDYGLSALEPDTIWYHGTSAPEFDQYRPGATGAVSFTDNFMTADYYSGFDGGILAAGNVDSWDPEGGRVISNHVNISEDTPIPVFRPDYSKKDSNLSVDRDFYQKVHEEATRFARGHGYPAYAIDEDADDSNKIVSGTDLVVLDAGQHVEIINQDADEDIEMPDTASSLSDAIQEYRDAEQTPPGSGGAPRGLEYRGAPAQSGYAPRSGRGTFGR